jgi:MFS transporter, DHA3 family, macrolide efflux protein
LLSLLIFFGVNNFLVGFVIVLTTPLMLSFTTPRGLATAVSFGSFGGLTGSILMSAWGGPARRMNGVISFYLLIGLCIMLIGARPSVALITVAISLFSFSLPIILGSSQAIWQSKVALDVQAQVFAVRRMIAWSSMPLAYLIAGPLADHVFEPLLAVNGPLAGTVGMVIGVGRGRGIGLLFIVLGSVMILTAAIALLYPRLRLLEDELPDVIPEQVVVKA